MIYHLSKSVSFTEKQHWRPKTGKKGGFEEIEREFIFCLEHFVRKNSTTSSDVPLLSRLPVDIDGTVLLFKTIFRYSNCFLSSVATSYRWQGWTWIENWKSWANVFQVLIFCPQKSTKTLLWLLLPDGIWLIFNSSYNLVPGSVLGEKAKKRSELNRGLGRVKGRRTFFSPHRTARLASLADRRPPFFSSSFSPTVRSLLPGYSS